MSYSRLEGTKAVCEGVVSIGFGPNRGRPPVAPTKDNTRGKERKLYDSIQLIWTTSR
jgi:hypothetical protein